MEIKYKTNDGFCLTECPFKVRGRSGKFIRVGSIGCVKCSHHAGRGTGIRTIICNADEETK